MQLISSRAAPAAPERGIGSWGELHLSGVEFRVARHEQERGPGRARPARCRAYWDIATYSRRPQGTGVLPAGSVSLDQGYDYASAPLEQTPSDGGGVVESRAGVAPLVCPQCCESHGGTRAGQRFSLLSAARLSLETIRLCRAAVSLHFLFLNTTPAFTQSHADPDDSPCEETPFLSPHSLDSGVDGRASRSSLMAPGFLPLFFFPHKLSSLLWEPPCLAA
jgi:hypothetical protein